MERVEILYSRSAYGTDRPNMNKEQTEEFKYPCAMNVNTKNELSCVWYSNINNKGHFGIPKVIFGVFGNGLFIDKNGDYGTCQHCASIIDKPENLIRIKEALQSEEFCLITEMLNVGGLGVSLNRKIIALFKKDFWKEFI